MNKVAVISLWQGRGGEGLSGEVDFISEKGKMHSASEFNICFQSFYRCHVVNEFNRGIYDYIIASDETGLSSASHCGVGKGSLKFGSRKRRRDKEYSVARGIDFQGTYVH